ncbi:MAG: PAS domain S-box protein [Turneriella sp.]
MPKKSGKKENIPQTDSAEILSLKFRIAQLEKALVEQQSRQRAAAIGEARMMHALRSFSTVGIFAADAAGKIVSASDGWYRILGLNADEGLGSDWRVNIHDDDRHLVECTAEPHAISEKVLLFRVREKSGGTRSLRIVSHPITTGEGITGYVGIIEDLVTEKNHHPQIAWRRIFENIPVPVLIVDKQHRLILYANHSMAEFSGAIASSLPGQPDTLIFSDAEQTQRILTQIGERGYITGEEIPVTLHDGKRKWVQLSCIVSEYDDITCLVYTFIDVTAQRQLIDRLKNSNSKVREIEVALNEHSSVAFTDSNGIITMVNDKFCETAGYSRMEVIGQDHRIINSGYHSRDFFRDMWQTIRGGQTWRGEIRNRRKDGSFYWSDTVIVPFLNAEQKPYQYVAIRRDISARKDAELTLARSEAHFRSIAEDMPAYVCVFLSEGTITYANESFSRSTGLRAFDLVGRNFYALLPHTESSELKAALAALTPSQPVFTRDQNLPDQTGKTRFIRWTVKAFFNSEGSAVYCQAFGQDLTLRKQVEIRSQRLWQRLEHAVDEIGQGILLLNSAREIIFANEPAMRVLDLALNEIAAKYYFKNAWRVADASGELGLFTPAAFGDSDDTLTLFDAQGNPSELDLRILKNEDETIVLIREHTPHTKAALIDWLEEQEHEREKLSEELEGVIGQNLKLLHSMVESLHASVPAKEHATMSRIYQMLSETSATASDMLLRLNPGSAKLTGMRQAIETYLQNLHKAGVHTAAADLGALDDFFPENWNTHFFRLTAEIFASIRENYASVNLRVRAWREAGGLVFSVKYDGMPLQPENSGVRNDHSRISARAALVPALVAWFSNGQGNEVRVILQKISLANAI